MCAKQYLGIGTAALVLCLAITGANAADVFTLQSETFQDGHMMPKKVAASTAVMPGNANCVGENISPNFRGPMSQLAPRALPCWLLIRMPGTALASCKQCSTGFPHPSPG